MSSLRVLPEAVSDLAEIVDWYNSQRAGLGDEFEYEFYNRAEEILSHPRMAQTVYREFRRSLLKRFPYGIYYRAHRQELVIALISHLARNPKTIRRTLRKRRSGTS
jgi:plasmid stabilization system protein ParE